MVEWTPEHVRRPPLGDTVSMAPYQQPGSVLPLHPVARRMPADPGVFVAARATLGFVAGVVALALAYAAVGNHRWISLSVGFPVAWLVGAALVRKPSLALGFLGGVLAVVALFGAFVIVEVVHWHLLVGAP